MEKERLEQMLKVSSPKVLAMYDAVNELMEEGREVYTLKISDITGRAGIGKGTAYEYFETKEELLSKAVFYQIHLGMCKMVDTVLGKHTFREQIYALFNDLEQNYQKRRVLLRYLSYYLQEYFVKDQLCQEFGKCTDASNGLGEFVGVLLEQARKEGLTDREFPMHFAVNVIFTQAMGFGLYLEKGPGAEEIESEQMKEFIYSNIVKMLG